MSMVSACVVRCSAARAGRPGDTDQREAGVRAALPLIPCTCVCMCACACVCMEAQPTHTAQRPSIDIHTHPCHSKTHNTFIKLQNRKKSSSQNFVNFLHQDSNNNLFPLHLQRSLNSLYPLLSIIRKYLRTTCNIAANMHDTVNSALLFCKGKPFSLYHYF